jgi:hypothetical protein
VKDVKVSTGRREAREEEGKGRNARCRRAGHSDASHSVCSRVVRTESFFRRQEGGMGDAGKGQRPTMNLREEEVVLNAA